MLIYVYVFMHYVYTIVSGGPPYQVGPYELRATSYEQLTTKKH